jgi:hypothetical protein
MASNNGDSPSVRTRTSSPAGYSVTTSWLDWLLHCCGPSPAYLFLVPSPGGLVTYFTVSLLSESCNPLLTNLRNEFEVKVTLLPAVRRPHPSPIRGPRQDFCYCQLWFCRGRAPSLMRRRSVICRGSWIKVKITLWPTVSRPVSLGVKSHLVPKTSFLLLSDSCGFIDMGLPI